MIVERLLVVGLGSIGRRHVRIARELLPDVEIVVLRHRDGDDNLEPGVDRCVATIENALRFRPQAAVIANPASHHLDSALPLARAGVHLLVEKPIASSSDGIQALLSACRERQSVLMIGYNLRFMPSLLKLRDLLNAKRIGRVFSVRAETGQFLPTWRPGSDYRTTVSAQAALGGGVLLELSHEIDYLRWLFGEIEWVSAVQRRQSTLDIDVEDTAHLVVGFSASAQAVPVMASLNIDFIRQDATRSCTVIGERGSLRWDALAGTVQLYEQDRWETIFSELPETDHSYRAEWRHFLTCVRDDLRPTISGDDGVAVLRIVEAARRSSASGSTVTIRPYTVAGAAERTAT